MTCPHQDHKSTPDTRRIPSRSECEERRLWLEENKVAIEMFNQEISQNGVWSDGWRRW